MASGYAPRGAGESATFDGAKAAVFIGDRLLVIRRDDRPGLAWPGALDFPGGGREAGESPEQTLAREIREEVGLGYAPSQLVWRRACAGVAKPGTTVWFFVLRLAPGAERGVVFGDEGQGWGLMTPAAFLAAPDAVSSLQHRLRCWIDSADPSTGFLRSGRNG